MTQKQADKLFHQKRLYISLFNAKISFFDNIEDFNKALKWRGHETEEHYGYGASMRSTLFHNETKEKDCIMILGVFVNSITVLAHEATHIALLICDQIGHIITPEDEIVPYLVQEIVGEFIEYVENIK